MSRGSNHLALLLVLGVSACATDPDANASSEAASETTGDELETSGDTTDTTDTSDTNDDVPDCTPGAFGCVCAEGDSCAPDLACVEGECGFSDCLPGWDGCPCDAQGGCDMGLSCNDGTCGCEPGSLGCDCTDNVECEAGGLSCIEAECWLPSAYPGCGWIAGNNYYFCGSAIAHPDYPIDCPVPEAELIVGMPCPVGLTFEGCCTATATYWCGNDAIATMACG